MATLSQLRFLVPGRGRYGAGTPVASGRPLAVSAGGADLIRSLRDSSAGSSRGGLRIVIDPRHRSLSMSLADRLPGDFIVAGHGAQVYLSAAASERLRGCTLRAGAVGSGSLFYLDRSLSSRSLVS